MARTFAAGPTDHIDYGHISSMDNAAALSAAFSFNLSALTDFAHFISQFDNNGGGSYDGWSVQEAGGADNDNLIVTIRNAGVAFGRSGGHTISTGTWYRMCFVYNGSLSGDANRLKMWIDGVAQTLTFDAPGIPATIGASVNAFRIGTSAPGEGSVAGSFAGVGVWSRALTDSEAIAQSKGYAPGHFRSNLTVNTDLIGRYSPELNIPTGGGTQGTVTNAATSAHPRLFYPTVPRYPKIPAVAVTGHGRLLSVARNRLVYA